MVRRYDADRPLPDEAIERLLRAATRGPSAGFTQGVELLVLRRSEDRRRFWASQVGEDRVADPDPWLAGMSAAPVVIAFLSRPQAYLDRYAERDKAARGRRPGPGAWPVPYWDVDAGMAALLALLAAVDEGLGACFFGLEVDGGEERLRAAFEIPPGWRCVGVVAVGYPAADQPASSATRRPRRTLAELVHEGRWRSTPDD
jgi:nitroreductase